MRKLPPFLFQPFFSGVTSLKMGIMLLQPPTTTMMVVVPSSISVWIAKKFRSKHLDIYFKFRLLFRKELENAGKGAWKKQKKSLKRLIGFLWYFFSLLRLYILKRRSFESTASAAIPFVLILNSHFFKSLNCCSKIIWIARTTSYHAFGQK